MIPIGFGVTLVGYTIGLWGYCMVKRYNITIAQLLSPTWPPPGKPVQTVGNAPVKNPPAGLPNQGKTV